MRADGGTGPCDVARVKKVDHFEEPMGRGPDLGEWSCEGERSL